MSAAHLSTTSQDAELVQDEQTAAAPFELTPVAVREPAALKQQVAERVAAHRARRAAAGAIAAPEPNANAAGRRPRGRSAEIAAAVAERYAHSQSYRTFLASEAERAVHQAEAVAQVATINAHAIAVAQQQLLDDLDHWENVPDMPSGPVAVPEAPLAPANYAGLLEHDFRGNSATPERSVSRVEAAYAANFSAADLPPAPVTVRHFEERSPAPGAVPTPTYAAPFVDEDERIALEDELEFRHNPSFADAGPPEEIAANLIEFPRQLVAPRKARPRLEEGPLRDGTAAASAPHLRIFEVEEEHASGAAAAHQHSPVWSSILLSARPAAEFISEGDTAPTRSLVPQVAPVSLRLMAAITDGCIVLAVQLVFTAVFVVALTHLSGREAVLEIPRMLAIGATAGTMVVLTALYQLLFFTLSDSTPGMRYARVGLCTFNDENPTRRAMRVRILATAVAMAPLGLGLIWALLDEDTLGWHDRISKMYQRAY